MTQQELIKEAEVKVEIADACREPRTWIRRLVVWETPEKIIRDIKLTRGLNIVWSPDTGATSKRKGKRRRGSGHGVGKTLLCRLIRYCLGEDTFASRDLEMEVRTAFKDGLVGAEVVIDGVPWGVVRPIGIGRKTRVAANQTPEQLVETTGTGIEPLLDALRAGVLGTGLRDVIAGTHEARDWLHALAWLARDQEARYNHLLEWRSTSSGSESPAANEVKAQLDDAARLLVGAMTAKEVACKKDLDGVVAQIARLERESAFVVRSVSELEQESLKAAGLESFEGAAALAIPRAAAHLRERLEAAEKTVDDQSAALAPVRTELEGLLNERGRLVAEREKLNGLVGLQNSNLNQLKGELTTLSAREIEAALGTSYCPVCNVAIDRAVLEGCGFAVSTPDASEVAADVAATERTRGTCEAALRDYRAQLGTLERQLKDLESKIEKQRNEIARIENQVRKDRDAQRAEWRAATRAQLGLERLERMTVRRDGNQATLQSLGKRQQELTEQLEAHRNAHAAAIRRWNALFRHVCSMIYGEDIACRLTLTGKGLQAKMPTGGLAMEALKVIAFDLATLLMSVEGRSKMPALLIHDSPREADLGEALYHGIFQAAVALEKLNKKAVPFQYIITTTSAPPADLEDRVILRLGSHDAAERLLGRDLS